MFIKKLLEENKKINKFDNFDFTKSITSNMSNDKIKRYETNFDIDLPIKKKKGIWENISDINGDNYIYSEFEFEDEDHMIFFLSEIISYSNKIGHHPLIVIDHKLVKIKLMTNNVNDITNADIELRDYIAEVFDDTKFMR